MSKATLIYLLFFPLTLLSQVDIENVSLIDPSLSILYIKVENDISLSGSVIDSNTRLTSATGRVFEYPHNEGFSVVPHYASTSDTLRLYQANELILTKVYELRRLENPITQLGVISDTIASLQQVLENPNLNIVIPDCHYDHNFWVIGFTMTLVQANGDTLKSFSGTSGNQLTDTQLGYIRDLRPGDKLAFTEITSRCPSSTPSILKPLTVSISNDN